MEAIAELIGALIAALVEAIAFAVIAAAELLVSVFALAAELLLVAVIHGVSAAKERYRERKRMAAIDDRGIDNEVALIRPHEIDLGSPEDEINADDSNVPLRQSERQPRSAVRRMTQRIRQRRRCRTALTSGQTILLSSLLLLSVGIAVGVHSFNGRIRQQKISETTRLIDQLADDFAGKIRDEDAAALRTGVLIQRDAWQQPLELFVDEMMLATLVVVRSPGPDQKSGSVDDLLATRVVQSTLKEAGGKVVRKGGEVIRERLSDLFRKDPEAPAAAEP